MLTDVQVQAHADKIRDDGFTVIENAASRELILNFELRYIGRYIGPLETHWPDFPAGGVP